MASSAPDAPALERARERDVPTAVFARARLPRPRGPRRGARRLGRGQRRPAGRPRRLHGAARRALPRPLPAALSSTCTLRCCRPFPGSHAIEQALAYGVKVFGVTVHFVDAGVDTGPVILQRAVELPEPRQRRGGARRRCAPSSTRCCRRPCGCSRRARWRPIRRTRGESLVPRHGVRPQRRGIGSGHDPRQRAGEQGGRRRAGPAGRGARPPRAALGLRQARPRRARARPARARRRDRLHRRHRPRARRGRHRGSRRSRTSPAFRRSWTGA